MSRQLEGIVVAMVTPFGADESLDEDGLRAVTRFLVGKGVHGLFPGGSQGEFYALSGDEQCRVLDIVLEAAGGKAFVVAHAGAITTRGAVSMARHAERAGADAVAMITPYFVSPSQDELYRHYVEVSAAVSLPLLGYNNPGRTAVDLQPATAARIARDAANFVGVKDSSGDLTQFTEYIRLCPVGFRAFMGRDSLILPALVCGAAGAVAATANVVPELVVGIYDAVRAGNHTLGLELQQRLLPLRLAFGMGTFPVVIKEAMQLLGLPVGPARSPVGPLTTEMRMRLRTVLQQMSVLGVEGV